MPRRRLAAVVAALCALGAAAPAARADDCAGADLVPAADNLAQVGQATLCLLNEQRAAQGLRPLVVSVRLGTASVGYSQRMVEQAFFAHVSPDGGTLVDRLSAVGYVSRAGGWVAGENIGWGQGPLSTARSMVTAWMNSPGHRANILDAEYRDIGLGLALGTPPDRSWGATYTTDFGRRQATVAAKRRPRVRTAASLRHARARATRRR
jgi:uncharacterized protein YkwD